MNNGLLKFALVLLTAFVLGLGFFAEAAGVKLGGDTPGPELSGLPKGSVQKLVWQQDLNAAFSLALAGHRPVFAIFTSPDCGWCAKMKAEVLPNKDVEALLANFALVEIDVSKDYLGAAEYMVRGVPSTIIFASDGRPIQSVAGYMGVADMLALLKSTLNPEFLRKMDSEYLNLLTALGSNTLPPAKLPALMGYLGDTGKRKELHDKLLGLNPFPKKEFVKLLDEQSLAVRLGSLDILEELSGDSFGFDPWLAPQSPENTEAGRRWLSWADSKDASGKAATTFTPEQIAAYIRDLISSNRELSNRALRMLCNGGDDSFKALAAFVSAHPELPAGSRDRIRAAQYSIMIPSVCGDGSAIASGLIFGTEDMKMKSLSTLALGGRAALPVLKDFLYDGDSLIRESAVDATAIAGGRAAVPLFLQLVAKEKDSNVIYAVIRNLGKIRSQKGMDLLVSYLSDKDEDTVIAALNSLAKLKAQKNSASLLKALDDPRWRVRAAALEAVSKLELKDATAKVEALLDDKDEFVRRSAVKTLAGISSSRSTKKLEELFLKDDQLKGAIVSAFCSMNLSIPKSFEKALDKKDPEVLLGVIGGLEDCKDSELGLLIKLSSHPDLSVSCAATRVLAMKGIKDSTARGRLIVILSTGSPEMQMAFLENLNYEHDDPSLEIDLESTNFAGDFEDSAVVREISDAFGIGAYEKFPKGKDGVEKPLAKIPLQRASLEDLFNTVETCLKRADSEEMKFRALIILAKAGRKETFAELFHKLPAYTLSQRTEILDKLEDQQLPKTAIPLMRTMLRDSSSTIREGAVNALVSRNPDSSLISPIFEELLRKGSLLSPLEVVKHCDRGNINSRNAGKWIERILNSATTSQQQKTMALIILERAWGVGSEALVEKYLKSDDQWQRRAAFFALGKNKPSALAKYAKEISEDNSEFVRAILPMALSRGSSRHVVYLDESQSTTSYTWNSSTGKSLALSQGVKDALAKLSQDPSSEVRLETFFCMMSNRIPFEVSKFIETVNALPERTSAQERIGDYLYENYKQLGPNMAVLVQFIESGRRERGEELDRIYKHFKINIEEDVSSESVASASDASLKPIADNSVQVAEEPKTGSLANEKDLSLVFFWNPGCKDCEMVKGLLLDLKAVFPKLKVEARNIRKQDSMRLNEALCDRFGVPAESHLVSPAVFCAGGFLIKKDISFDRLCSILSKSSEIPQDGWLGLDEQQLAKAGESIERRFSNIGGGLVAFAGLLDGVNPCAFATIIFLLSYLQVARRTPSQIMQVGIAFIVGVFITYFALGLGLVEVVSRLSALGLLGRLFNWALAAFCLLIMIFNIKDGVLCLQGRLKETALQLPGFLKDGIHATIRHGARHSNFVIAAFFIGVAISVLELACTGQVYAPTILYIIQSGGRGILAFAYLAVYNLAFILPLVVIFLLSYFGMRSDSLAKFMERHAALVKFCTAAVFLLIFMTFVFGDKIAALPEMLDIASKQ